jgi:hypothetical protein
MAKKTFELDLQSVEDQILLAALSRIAGVLKPYPKDVPAPKVAEAVANLRQRNLVHGGERAPNLTRAGVEAARTLAGR